MSDCQKFESDLSALIDGELPGNRQAEVIEHVDHCPQCSQRVAELQKLVTGIAALPAAPMPPQFLADVRRKLRHEKSSWVDTLFRPVWWKVPLEALAAVIVVAGIFALTRPAKLEPKLVAKARSVSMSAKILDSEPATETAKEKLEVLRDSPPAPTSPVVIQPQVAAASVGVPPELPEALMIRGDSVVAVRLRVENLAKEFAGRIEPVTPSNAFLVYLPQSRVAAFRAGVTGAVGYAVAKPVESAEPVVGVRVIVEP